LLLLSPSRRQILICRMAAYLYINKIYGMMANYRKEALLTLKTPLLTCNNNYGQSPSSHTQTIIHTTSPMSYLFVINRYKTMNLTNTTFFIIKTKTIMKTIVKKVG